MTVDFKDATRINVYKFDPKDIVFDPTLNGRHELSDIEWLIKDILHRGQLEPVIIRKNGDKAVLCAGFSRWRAIVEINKRKLTPEALPIIACYSRGNELQGFIAGIAENRFRNSTTELDDAYNITRLRNYQMTDDAIAAIYFPDLNGDRDNSKKAVAWVRKRARLATLTPEAEKAMKEGRIKPSAAAHLAALSAEVQRETLKQAGKKVTSADVRKSEGKNSKITMAELKKELATLAEKDLTADELVDRLEAILKRI